MNKREIREIQDWCAFRPACLMSYTYLYDMCDHDEHAENDGAINKQWRKMIVSVAQFICKQNKKLFNFLAEA